LIETLGHYKVLERIGAGGLGEVYRARDMRLGRTVAIKVIPPELEEDAEGRERFLADARAAMAVSHPNIAELYEIGDDRGLFLVYEFAPGETLNKAIAGHPLNPRRAVDLAIQIADALAEAHAQGVVHGDIRPENIIETPKGAAKILDLGLSAWTRGGAARRHAAQLNLAADSGEPDVAAYLSPEQAVGEPVDHRTDIFSFGVVAFEMFTGRQPFVGATPAEIALQIAQAKPPRPTDVNKSLPREFDQVIGRALAKSLEQRWQASATLAAELRGVSAILEERTLAEETGRAVRPVRRSRAGLWVTLALVGALAAGAWAGRAAITRAVRAWLPSAGQQ